MSIVELFSRNGINKEEFKQLFDDKFEPLKLYIYYKCGDESLASDITQDVFTKVWENRKNIRKSTVNALLYTMANNLFISECRRNKRDIELHLKDEAEETHISAEEAYVYSETKKRYENTLNTMPCEAREVFLMSRIEELKYREIADRLQISIKTVEKRMSIALGCLRQELRSVV
ncbi:MAG: RNA polymerase sigma-70 factor [Carboxylicivirga sp.]|jgi:RNA polymerase sigma-70 factor (ECF subfamily)|nr:RNA polymerase sigma-70 factor [Carboxylicivirga sp.]